MSVCLTFTMQFYNWFHCIVRQMLTFHYCISQAGKLAFASASENLARRVENRPGRVQFCIGYIGTVAKQSFGRKMRPIKRSGDPEWDITNYRSGWRPENLSCQSPYLILWLSKYKFFQYFYSDNPKLMRTTQRTSWVVCWATQDFSLAAALYIRDFPVWASAIKF